MILEIGSSLNSDLVPMDRSPSTIFFTPIVVFFLHFHSFGFVEDCVDSSR